MLKGNMALMCSITWRSLVGYDSR